MNIKFNASVVGYFSFWFYITKTTNKYIATLISVMKEKPRMLKENKKSKLNQIRGPRKVFFRELYIN